MNASSPKEALIIAETALLSQLLESKGGGTRWKAAKVDLKTRYDAIADEKGGQGSRRRREKGLEVEEGAEEAGERKPSRRPKRKVERKNASEKI